MATPSGVLLGAAFTWGLLMFVRWNERQYREDVVKEVSRRRRTAAWVLLATLTVAGLILLPLQ